MYKKLGRKKWGVAATENWAGKSGGIAATKNWAGESGGAAATKNWAGESGPVNARAFKNVSNLKKCLLKKYVFRLANKHRRLIIGLV